jgi:F-type H+-transporting ATPase subunit b
LISKEIYILNEETLVLIATTGLLGVLLKYLREPFTNMADEHIAVSIWERERERSDPC